MKDKISPQRQSWIALKQLALWSPPEMSNFRIYLPARNSYHDPDGCSSQHLLESYVAREFPGVADAEAPAAVYPVPKAFACTSMERQAASSEALVFRRLQHLHVAGLWCVFFHGRSYGGSSFRNQRDGKLVIREHDFVVFASHKGRMFAALLEVKSTCDDAGDESCTKISDAKMIKNNKRSAQHQLRDHMEIMRHELVHTVCRSLGTEALGNVQNYICWPFLSATTTGPQRKEARRWAEDGTLHVFRDCFRSQQAFDEWFRETVLPPSQSLPRPLWLTLLQRFIVSSCGVFLDELSEGMLALLTQDQLQLLHHPPFHSGRPLVIHGAAGTGKTLLVLHKLQLLHEQGELHDAARALYICYWPGIRCEVVQRLEKLGVDRFVDTARFYIAMDGFLKHTTKTYHHVFMDEAEAICLALNETIIQTTFERIARVHGGGCLWYLVDINQAAIFLPKHSPNLLKTPDVVLRKVMRSTGNIYRLFQAYYSDPFPLLPPAVKQSAYTRIAAVELGHDTRGPPVYWAESTETRSTLTVALHTVIDLCSAKGIQPNDLCVIPFFVTDEFLQKNVNCEISKYFVENGFMPQALCNVESFLINRRRNHFVIPWVLRAKGLEFKVVVLVIEDDDIDLSDPEDRRKLYIMSSRCTCMLIVVSSAAVKRALDTACSMLDYPLTSPLL